VFKITFPIITTRLSSRFKDDNNRIIEWNNKNRNKKEASFQEILEATQSSKYVRKS